MYENFDYNLYKNNLREAEQQRKQNELLHLVNGYARLNHGDSQKGLLSRFIRVISPRAQPKQASSYAKRAAAL